MAAKCPTARASGYNSSKAAVTGFYNSLRQELVGSGVTVTGIYPYNLLKCEYFIRRGYDGVS